MRRRKQWPWRALTSEDVSRDFSTCTGRGKIGTPGQWLERFTGEPHVMFITSWGEAPYFNSILWSEVASQLDGMLARCHNRGMYPWTNRQLAEAFNQAMRNLGMIDSEGYDASF